jgi:hypothetical protein
VLEIACNQQLCQKRGWHSLDSGPLTEELVHGYVDRAGCVCCTVSHDHTGIGCRPVTISVLPGVSTMNAKEGM